MFYSLKLSASYRAGNITYSWISGYTYQIKYTTYTTNSSPDNYCEIDSVCFGDGTQGALLRINGSCGGACSPACEGLILSSSIKMNEYTATHTYPGPGNYLICFDQPNRNGGIVNMPNSINQTMYFESYLVIPTFGSGKNTSAAFANHPIANGCMNNGCFTYNPLATDADGDSLSYEIMPCKSNSSANTPGYSYPNAGASGTFSIDPVSGLLSWCNPQLQGDYNVVIKITEWRKDDGGNPFMLGYVLRDTQLSVLTCTGINELKGTENAITIFPNPVTETLTISFNQNNNESFVFELVDLTGRSIKLLNNNEVFSKQHTITLNLEDIQKGIYFLNVIGSNHTKLTKKIIKQ